MPSTLRRGCWYLSSSSTVMVFSVMVRLDQETIQSGLLENSQLFSPTRLLVVVVQRIASRGQPIAWSGRAITECSTDPFALDVAALGRIPENLRIRQHHSSETNEIGPSLAHGGLGNVRQEILQVRVSRSDNKEIWK